ncbi:MAG: hypothetical protein DYG88_18655 [Chloroflexi bacterium CFX4]|nr:hypothetical protein [Chloroflexi bacterium CFX4]MDL1924629.1 hypothetical protein [Chloroflexi bacterium CFX3]
METPPKRHTEEQPPEADWLAGDTLIVPPPSFRERLQAAQRARDTQQTEAAPNAEPPKAEDEAKAAKREVKAARRR